MHSKQERRNLGKFKQKKRKNKHSDKLKQKRNTSKSNENTTFPVEDITLKRVKQKDSKCTKSGQSLKDASKTNSVKRKDKPTHRETNKLDTIFEDIAEQINEKPNKTADVVNILESEDKRENSDQRNAGSLKITINSRVGCIADSSLPNIDI